MKDTNAVSHAVDACQHKLTARQTEFIAVIETCTSGRRPIPESERRHSPRSLVPRRVCGRRLLPRNETDTIGQLQRGMRITLGDVMTPISTEALPYDSSKLVASVCPHPFGDHVGSSGPAQSCAGLRGRHVIDRVTRILAHRFHAAARGKCLDANYLDIRRATTEVMNR